MKKFILFTTLVATLLFPREIMADAYSQGEVSYNISIDKKIRPINDQNFYDNISRDQKIFVSGDIMDFNVVVENTGKDILYNLVVKDYYPVVNQIILAPGEIDSLHRQISWKIDSLAAGESKTFTIRAKVIGGVSVASQTNIVEVRNNNAYDRDTATFFVSGKIMPATGSNDIVVKSAIIASLIIVAFTLRKVARGY